MDRENIIRKLNKLYVLKTRGVGGEKFNAQKLYDKLCKEYHITSEKIDEEKTFFHALS